MGQYLYEQTRKQIQVEIPGQGMVTCAEIKYWTKPYYDLWDESYLHSLSAQEKRILASYRAKKRAAENMTPNEYVYLKSSEDDTVLIYRWVDCKGTIIFLDDPTFGDTLKRVGVAIKAKGIWSLMEVNWGRKLDPRIGTLIRDYLTWYYCYLGKVYREDRDPGKLEELLKIYQPVYPGPMSCCSEEQLKAK